MVSGSSSTITAMSWVSKPTRPGLQAVQNCGSAYHVPLWNDVLGNGLVRKFSSKFTHAISTVGMTTDIPVSIQYMRSRRCQRVAGPWAADESGLVNVLQEHLYEEHALKMPRERIRENVSAQLKDFDGYNARPISGA